MCYIVDIGKGLGTEFEPTAEIYGFREKNLNETAV